MIIIDNKTFDEERALYGLKNTIVKNCKFDGPADGESAFKECENITVEDCFFNLRYPFWHVNTGTIIGAYMTDKCRAALWYDNNLIIKNSKIHGIKALRECHNISLDYVDVVSPEFLWRCNNIEVKNTTIKSEYPFFECKDVTIDNLNMKGKYSFQYVENMTIANSKLDTKDAFWHSKNVTVIDSVVRGEYLGWYAENLKFVRCKILGTQSLCYCKNLILEDCTMEETDLSFERSEVNAVIDGKILSIKNPYSGRIEADEIEEILIETQFVDSSLTEIVCNNIGKYVIK